MSYPPDMRPNLIFIPYYELILLYVLAAVAVLIFLYGFYLKYRFLDPDKNIKIKDVLKYLKQHWKRMLKNFFIYAFFQKKLLKNRYAGLMHIFIYAGILLLFASTSFVFLDNDILTPFGYRILAGALYKIFMVWSDFGGVILIIGLLMALYRRITKFVPLETLLDDYVVLIWLLIIAIQGFFLEGLNLYLITTTSNVYTPWLSYRFVGIHVSSFYSYIYLSYNLGVQVYQILWIVHATTAFALIAYLPFSKLSHIFLSSLNISLYTDGPRGRMTTPFNLEQMMQTQNFEFKLGMKNFSDMTIFDKIEAIACTNCGRCERACPAYAAGRDLDPRVLIQNLKKGVEKIEKSDLVSITLSEDGTWSCTTCLACVEECPVLIKPSDFILEYRRTLVSESRFDKQKAQFLNNLTYTKNPYGYPASDRALWLKDVPKFDDSCEYLYWIGCVAAFDPRAQKVAESVIKLLKESKIKFGVLGSEEVCCGESARRLGEEGRYQELVLENISNFKKYNVKKIIISCPHGYNTFKNEYSKFGIDLEVFHYTEILNRSDTLKLKPDSRKVTYHDPCYLGRINNKYEEPRLLLSKVSEIKEMNRSKQNSFCCGGGGANVWYKVPEKEAINQIRLKEAVSTSVDTVAVCCPFCLSMLEDAARTLGMEEKLKVKDMAELLAEHLDESR